MAAQKPPALNIDKTAFAEKANKRFKQARGFWQNWRSQARDDYAFISGDQWLEADEAILTQEDRPNITFNYSEKMIDAVVGAQVSNRQEVSYEPRSMEDAQQCELWNATAKWVRQECAADDEETDAFRDALICGLGWTRTYISYDDDLDGMIMTGRIDPLEMYADPAATRPGLMDRRWSDWEYWVDEDEAKKTWQDGMFTSNSDSMDTGVVTRGRRYSNMDNARDDDAHEGQVKIRVHECYEVEPVYRVAVGNDIQELSEKDFKSAKSEIDRQGAQYVKQGRRVYYRAFFSGETMLQVIKSPCQEGFTFQAITCKRDRNKNTWYGLTRVMKDPQRWANKWLSQILHIVNSNAKGGLLAEIGAFVDPVKAQEEWSKPDSVTLLNEGAMGKVEQKINPPYPSGLDKLMEFALSSLPMVTGINLEALGLADREQAGILEQQRKQAAYGLLSPIFDALKRYRKAQGQILLYYIDNYISDGRKIRIGGPELAQYLPLTKAKDAIKYDVIVDDAPESPDVKQKTWDSLIQLVPTMLKAGVPIPPDLLDYTPLPAQLVSKWKQFIGQNQQQNDQSQQQIAELQQENDRLQQQLNDKSANLQMKMKETQAEIMMKQQQLESEQQLAQVKAAANFKLEAFKQDRQFELENRRMSHEQNMKRSQMENDFKIKAVTAGVNADEAGKFKIDVSTGDLPDLINQFTQASNALAQQAQQSNHATLDAITRLTDVLSRPRQLVLDSTGRPVGSVLQ